MSAVYYAILQAVYSEIHAALPTLSVKVRRKIKRVEEDTLPLCLIAPAEDGERIVEETFSKNVIWDYPVYVAYLEADNGQLSTGLDSFLLTRETIRNAIYKLPTLSGNSTKIWDFHIVPEGAVKYSEYLGTNVDFTLWRFNVRSAETRA